VSRLLASFLLIVAVLIQCSPLRTCEWTLLLSGHSCHDAKVVSVGTDSGVRTAEVARHDAGPVTGSENTCGCNTPKGTVDHGGGAPVGPGLTPFVAGPVLVFAPASFTGVTGAGVNDAVPFGPTPPQHTPLLI
jgi:glycerol uptake facilitator-like aquaporin